MNEPTILLEDAHLLVLNKPALMHSVSQEQSADSVAHWISLRYPELTHVATNPLDSGLVNRLDFETSGLLLAAKTSAAWNALREQYDAGAISKKYLAIVEGALQTAQRVEGYISNRYRGSKRVRLTAHQEKRSQFTRSEISPSIQTTSSSNYSLVQVTTTTGARHQVRAHCASINHALAGDSLYGAAALPPFAHIGHFILHAATMTVRHPESGQHMELTAPNPGYIECFFKNAHSGDQSAK